MAPAASQRILAHSNYTCGSPHTENEGARPKLLIAMGAATIAGLAALGMPGRVHCVPNTDAAATSAYTVSEEVTTKYGIYPPWCRLNVDQVPLPFVNDMDKTYELKGAKRVAINQLGPSLSKRQATGQLAFRPAVPPPEGCSDSTARALYDKYLQEQPAPCILFRGKGRISADERAAYPKGLVVLWQDKAWVDRPVAVEWVEKVMEPFVQAERDAGVAIKGTTRYLLFQDNLDSQKQPEYIQKLKDLGIDDHKVPPNETDQVQPVDRGLGQHVKLYLGRELDKWLEDDTNLALWEDGTLTASDRRILLATWYDAAVRQALEGEAKLKYFRHAGALMTADGTDDDLIKLEGTPAGYKLSIPPPS